MNFNANSSECYTLHVSNEKTEMSLPPEHISSGSNFEVDLNPPLDLAQLSFLQSPDVEVRGILYQPANYRHIAPALNNATISPLQVRVDTLLIDSSPLLFRADPDENIKTYVTLATHLARDNVIFSERKLEIKNNTPLVVNLSDFYSADIHQAVRHVNTLLSNGSNMFLIARYSELFLDHHGIFDFRVFDKLDGENIMNVTRTELELLLRYLDIGFFARFEIIQYLNGLSEPLRPITKLIPYNVTYLRPSMTSDFEAGILRPSKFFLPLAGRSNIIIEDGSAVQPNTLIDLSDYYDVELDSNKRKRGAEANANNAAKVAENKRKITSRLFRKLRIIDKATTEVKQIDGKAQTVFVGESKKYAEEIISHNIELFKIGQKIRDLIAIEIERLKNSSNSQLFTRPFAAIGLDISETKVKFYLEFTKLAERSHISIVFSPILSYKLGSSRDITTQNYNKITIGPISLADVKRNETGVAHNIMSPKQRLSASMRIFPKLLIIACDILSEQSRQMEKEQTFFTRNDMVSFFKVSLKPKTLGTQFIAIEASKMPSQPFFRVHKARTHLNSFKVMLFDENGEFLLFPRDTIVKIALTFRPSPLT